MEYVIPSFEKIIIPAMTYAFSDKVLKSKIQSKMKNRTIEDIKVLQTMLERCSKSSNRQLKMDLEKHGIPNRIKKIAQTLTETHNHDWPESEKNITLFECIKDEHKWNSRSSKLYYFIKAIDYNMQLADCVIVCHHIPNWVEYNVAWNQINAHAKEVDEKLSGLIEEIEALYSQTQCLINANQLK